MANVLVKLNKNIRHWLIGSQKSMRPNVEKSKSSGFSVFYLFRNLRNHIRGYCRCFHISTHICKLQTPYELLLIL